MLIIIPIGLCIRLCREDAERRRDDREVIIQNGGCANNVELEHGQNSRYHDERTQQRPLNTRAFYFIGIMSIVCGVLAVVAQIVGHVKSAGMVNELKYHTTTTRSYIWDYQHYDIERLRPYKAWSGLWGGVIYAVTGLLSVLAARKQTRPLVNRTMAMAILSQIVSYVLLIIGAMTVKSFQDDVWYITQDTPVKVCVAMGAVLVGVSITMIIASLTLSVYCCKNTNCYTPSGGVRRTTVITTSAVPTPMMQNNAGQTNQVYGVPQVHGVPQVQTVQPVMHQPMANAHQQPYGVGVNLTRAQNEEMVHNMQQLQKRNKELRQQLQAQQMPAPPAYMEEVPY